MDFRHMLDIYIHDYLVKKNLVNSAKTFTREAQLPLNSTVIDAPNSFLWEWWGIFWDMYGRPMANDETLNMNANAQQLQQQQPSMSQQMLQQLPQQQPSMNSDQQMVQQFQQLQACMNSDQHIMQQLQQQQASMNSDQQMLQQQPPMISDQQLLQQMQMQLLFQQQSQQQHQKYLQQKKIQQLRLQHSTAKSSLANQIVAAHSMNREDVQRQKEILSEVEAERCMQTSVQTAAQLFPKATDASTPRSGIGGDQHTELKIRNLPARNLKSSYGMKDGKRVLLGVEGLKNSGTPSLSCTASGSNPDLNSSLLKGWPLRGFDQLQPGVTSHQNTLPHLNHNPHIQSRQKVMELLPDHNTDKENIRTDKDGIGNDMKSVPVGIPISSLGNAWTSQHEQQRINQKYVKPLSLEPLAQRSNYQHQQPDRVSAVGNTWRDVGTSNTSKDNDQTSKDQTSKKRKQPMLSGGPSNTSTAANAASASSVSAPLTPQADANDVIPLPALPPDYNSSKADLENTVDKVSLEDGFGSFLSSDIPETGIVAAGILDTIQDMAFLEIATLNANGVKFCNLSLDGKFIATGGDDKKAILWCTELGQQKCELEHSGLVTDLCFAPRLPKVATSSVDGTVKIWNIDSPVSSIRTFAGHRVPVLSVDFHPKKEDLVCSCDDANSIRYWSIQNGYCSGMHMVSATQVRFEPTSGKHLAASIENGMSIFNVETMQKYMFPLKKCHATAVRSVCWNPTGEFLASMSEDTIRVWKFGSWERVYELKVSHKKLSCCSFHPLNSSMLLIGSNESLELWHMAENKMVSVIKEPTQSLSVSKAAGMVASVSDDRVVKVWK